MLSYGEFEKYILLIKEYSDKDEKISELMDTEGFINYSGKAVMAIVELLEKLMQDEKDQWIQYWLWECNFGRDAEERQVLDSEGIPIQFKTISNLYDMVF